MPEPAIMTVPTFACAGCGRVQERRRTAGRGFAYHQRFCSIRCGSLHRARPAPSQVHHSSCEECGASIERRRRMVNGRPKGWIGPTRFCGRACSAKHTMSANVGTGVGYLDKNGYRIIRAGGVAIPEHRHVMERHLGRKLRPEETVHHRNGDREHNAIANLELWSSRHSKGQRVEDRVAFAISLLRDYPEVAAAQGHRLAEVWDDASNDNMLSEQMFRSYGSTMASAISSWDEPASYTGGIN